MASLTSWEKLDILRCERFLKGIEAWVDPTWGFCVYGTYTRPQVQKDSDNEYFQAVLNKLHAHAADKLVTI